MWSVLRLYDLAYRIQGVSFIGLKKKKDWKLSIGWNKKEAVPFARISILHILCNSLWNFFEISSAFFVSVIILSFRGANHFGRNLTAMLTFPHTLKCFLFVVPVEFQDTPEGTWIYRCFFINFKSIGNRNEHLGL